MKESVTQFGKSVKLTGIVAKPDNVDPSKPALIVFNSGVRHHVGCCRMSVTVARMAAELGMPSLRFDLSGVGDSPLRTDSKSYEESSMEEAQEAMDYLSRTMGVNSFLFYGLCSGAHLGFKTAQIDDRVKGLIQIDGYLYKTPKYHLLYYIRKMMSLKAWITFLKNRINEATEKATKSADAMQMEIQEWPDIPPKEETEEGYKKLIAKSVDMLFFVTGASSNGYNYEGQFYDIFSDLNFGSLMQIEHMPAASHILAEQASQQRVTEATYKWLQEKFAG